MALTDAGEASLAVTAKPLAHDDLIGVAFTRQLGEPREQVLEGAAIALRIGGDDHLVGRTSAADELLSIKGTVLMQDRVEANRDS